MLDKTSDYVADFAKTAAVKVPQPIQLVVAFLLYPLYWLSFVYLMTCIPVIGVVAGHVAVLKLTGSITLAVLAIPGLPGFAFFFWVFGTAWSKKIPGMAAVLTLVWMLIAVVGGFSSLLYFDIMF